MNSLWVNGTSSSVVKKSELQTSLSSSSAGNAAPRLETILLFGKPCAVLRSVQHGAKSTVYLCQNTNLVPNLPMHFAVKRMFFAPEQAIEAQREMDLMRPLSSAFIVALTEGEVARNRGVLCVSLVMEYCPGGSLENRMLQHNGMSYGDVVSVACCVAAAIAYLHSRQPPIAHRDVKLENILESKGGVFKLCDFGSATTTAAVCRTVAEAHRVVEEAARTTTLAYRAPELVDPFQGARVDEQVDVWAFGVAIYALLFHKFPFEETSLAIVNGTPEAFTRHSDTTDEVRCLIVMLRGCLEKCPSKRWTIFDVILYLQSPVVTKWFPQCQSFPFEVTQRPEGWIAQPLHQGDSPFVDLPSAAPQPKATQLSLFSQLLWQSTSPTVSEVAPTAPKEEIPAVRQGVAPSAVVGSNALDDLFSWDPAPSQTPSLPASSSHAHDDFTKFFV